MNAAREQIELTCKSGHSSKHLLDRVLRQNDAWCNRCGADLPYMADKLPEALDASSKPAGRSGGGATLVGFPASKAA